MQRSHEAHAKLDVRTKLLVMLALLSLPLLVMSLIQLNSYQRSLNEQTATIARIETAAAEGALESWLKEHLTYVETQETTLPPAAALNLYRHLRQHTSPSADAAIAVLDAKGRAVPDPSVPAPVPIPSRLSSKVQEQRWSDGATRVTGANRAEGFDWTVAIGLPLAENTPAGRSMLMLTATWALALFASSSLAVWAVGRFTKPLRKLAASASSLGEGQLEERVLVETDDEVGTLAGSLNIMAERLQSKFDELRTQGAFIEEVLDTLPLGVAVLDSSLIVRKDRKSVV